MSEMPRSQYRQMLMEDSAEHARQEAWEEAARPASVVEADRVVARYLYVLTGTVTDAICASIHREVCEYSGDDDHEAGGAHRPCETNRRHGQVALAAIGLVT